MPGTSGTIRREKLSFVDQLRTFLAGIAFYDNVSSALVRASKLLDNGGLPDIFNHQGTDFPRDLEFNVLAQFKKLTAEDFDGNLQAYMKC